MVEPIVRKRQLNTARVFSAGGRALDPVHHCGSVAAVVDNPFVGTFVKEEVLGEWMAALQPLADDMAVELRDALSGEDREIQTFGKGAIVGVSGELEVAAAWHIPGGQSLRNALGSPKSMVPASKKVGALGSQVDIPLVYMHASFLRSHYDAQPVVVPDAPRPNEVVYALVMTTGPRPHHRIGGFTIDDVTGEDGLR